MYVPVLLPLPLSGPYDYGVSEVALGHEGLVPGCFVIVPLGGRHVKGVVWGLPQEGNPSGIDPKKLKTVIGRLDVPPLPEVLLRFIDWVASYSLSPPGAVLRMVMSVPAALEPPKMQTAYEIGASVPTRLTPARQRVLDVAQKGGVHSAAHLAKAAGVSSSVVTGLAKAGALRGVEQPQDLPFAVPQSQFHQVALTQSQADGASVLKQAVAAATFSCTLLDGVTGSGKTETYFEAIAQALEQSRQVLILVPEIALTHQFLSRFEARFGCAPAAWHSDLSQKERRRAWRQVASGEVKVLVGARSALFLPFCDLGLLIVDEEHEQAFKQEEGVRYHARDMAVVRASLGDVPIILASATPSLETVTNVEQGRYEKVVLPARYGAARLPEISAVDLRSEPPPAGHWLSPVLLQALKETFEAGQQAMLYLNRRGYAPLTLCRACGHRLRSPHSSSWLVEHRYSNRLVCHQTGFSMPKPKLCPECKASDSLVGVGPGVERVAEEVQAHFPERSVAILSSDTVGSPKGAQALINAMTRGDIDVMVGTQMVAKGHHFPGLTMVGVVDADLGLGGGDLRAAERTFQLLWQVAGRAGRAQEPGRVLLQTYMPEHEVIQALLAGDRDAFMALEAEIRAEAQLPPFGRLAGLIVSGMEEMAVKALATALVRAAPSAEGVLVLGPAPAPFALLRGRHRYRVLVKASKNFPLQAYLRAWVEAIAVPRQMRVTIDVDPYSFL